MDTKHCIKAIDRASVHKICSGQVVLSLATAVKELVENSIDAGATIVDVRLKHYGKDLVEVIDNGNGVKESDFEGLTLKHHTSKIADFSDLSSVGTFGFRGEALSSLCSLCHVEIVTCHSEADVGTRLIFDHAGNITQKSATHRQVGTTVSLKNLFVTLPVRHKEFHKNLNKEFSKMVSLLNAYCIVSQNKRITCTNITDKGRQTTVMATNCSSSIKENLISVFGNKQVDSLVKLEQVLPSELVLEEFSLHSADAVKAKIFELDGYISSTVHGRGRSTSDRQFFFINGRPCDLTKVSKIMNNVYHMFNRHQYPFIYLNIILKEGSADVNVTPDKRLVFIPEEKILMAVIKTSLMKMYESEPSEMAFAPSFLNNYQGVSSSTEMKEKSSSPSGQKRSMCDEVTLSQAVKSQRMSNEETDQKNGFLPTNSSDESPPWKGKNILPSMSSGHISSSNVTFEGFRNNSSPKAINFSAIIPFKENKFIDKLKTTSNNKAMCPTLQDILKSARWKSNTKSSHSTMACLENDISNQAESKFFQTTNVTSESQNDHFSVDDVTECNEVTEINHVTEINAITKINHITKINDSVEHNDVTKIKDFIEHNGVIKINDVIDHNDVTELECGVKKIPDSDDLLDSPLDESCSESFDEPFGKRRKYVNCHFTVEALRSKLKNRETHRITKKTNYLKFRSKISPNDNQQAEEELRKEISKDLFSHMEVIGQFNLGFIITKLQSDLFIVDQHATDEKYNFEVLQRDNVLETQKLIVPLNLDLTVASKAVLLDNLSVFEKNGFKFDVDEDTSISEKIQLVSVPVCYNWSFGKEDVDELIFMLTDNPMQDVRPSRVSQMFASRACRKSVMIGTALSVQTMKKLITHMGEIDQPWNCPHGRPTMRHLFNLNLLHQE